jgi:hypothetical protein
MAADENDTLFECSQYVYKINECLNAKEAGNLSREAKAKVLKLVNKLQDIINKQNQIISDQKLNIISDFEKRFERQSIENENINKQLIEISSKLDSKFETKSYSAVLKTNKGESTVNKPKNLVVIKPKKPEIDSKQTKKAVIEMASKHKLSVGVNSIRNIKSGGLIINCNNGSELNKLIEKINTESEDIIADKPKKRIPRIAVYGVNEDLTENELRKEIIANNQSIEAYFENKAEEVI